MTLTCQALLAKFSQEWQAATIHPFLQACQSGTIEPTQFHTWLVQDYLFVTEFTRFVGRVLAAAPIQDFDVLLVGLSALQDKLQWFGEKAAERSLTLSTPPCLTCQRYSDFMGNLVNAPYAVQAVALWAIEYAYNQGWQLPGKMPRPMTNLLIAGAMLASPSMYSRWHDRLMLLCRSPLLRRSQRPSRFFCGWLL
jgi:thiaminase/transcriptional activator TenA